jgi:hypothetical protein
LRDLPVAYWRLGDPCGSYADDETAAHDGTCYNSPTFSLDGALSDDANTSIGFNGTDQYIEAADDDEFDITDEFTIELWIKADDAAQDACTLIGKGTKWRVTYCESAGIVKLDAVGYSGSDPKSYSSITVNDTDWHHIAYTYDGVNFKTYLDGEQVTSTTLTFSLGTGSDTVNIARSACGDYYDGRLDEIAIYDYAVPDSRIKQHYNISQYNSVMTSCPVITYGVYSWTAEKLPELPHAIPIRSYEDSVIEMMATNVSVQSLGITMQFELRFDNLSESNFEDLIEFYQNSQKADYSQHDVTYRDTDGCEYTCFIYPINGDDWEETTPGFYSGTIRLVVKSE